MSTQILFDVAAFRLKFPPYAVEAYYPTAILQGWWDTAILYVSNVNGGCYVGGMSLAQQTQALMLMTAHLIYLSGLITSGNTPGVVTQASIDKVSVTIEPPPSTNQWQYWLQTTPYGQQLLALLQVIGVGGFYIGGAGVFRNFRR